MTKHTKISLAKSTLRIFGCMLIPFNLWHAAAWLIIAEVLGIVEELAIE